MTLGRQFIRQYSYVIRMKNRCKQLLNRYTNPAVVIGGTLNALGVIRNLGRYGIDVYCVVDTKDESVYSKYCKNYFVIPGVTSDILKLRNFLFKFKAQTALKPVLFPTSDISVLNISRLLDEIRDDYIVTMPPNFVLKTLIKKRKFYTSLIEKQVPHPHTIFLENGDLGKNIKNMDFPVLIKPSMSQIFVRRFRKKGFLANSEQELRKYLDLTRKYGIDTMVQEIIPGPISNQYVIDGYFDKSSKPRILFARQRLRMWPITLGLSTVCVSVPISRVLDMKEAIVKYLVSQGFQGLFNAEFKIDTRDNEGKLFDINPRSWGGGGITNTFDSACGVNIILAAYLDAIDRQMPMENELELGAFGINFFTDFVSCVMMLTQGDISFTEILAPYRGKKYWNVFATDDIKPFPMYIKDIIHATISRIPQII